MITLTIIILALIGISIGIAVTIVMLTAGMAFTLIACADVLIAVAVIYFIVRLITKR